ncbi:MAG: MBL fold metallo-hydrolase [Oligoflexia bacterium]|nr:MBL fold metallo-hydrolase [Oligoflexia bacterium]
MLRANIHSLLIGPEKNFCYLIYCSKTNTAALVDSAFEFDRVIKWVNSFNPQHPPEIKYLIATHGHSDHAGGFPEMLKILPNAKVVAHEFEKQRLQSAQIPLHKPLKDHEEFQVGEILVRALHTPGHTEGGCCYLIDDQLLSGDTLFVGQCGRTDLPGGSDSDLFLSLQKLKKLPATTRVFPGHDYGVTPTSTIEIEMLKNPTLIAKSLQDFIALP